MPHFPISQKSVAVMFADVVGSSALYCRLGDAEANRRISELLATLIEVTETFQGELVKTIGDEIMVRFPDAEQACISAFKIQEEAAQAGYGMRIGIGFGSAVLQNNDVFGDTVNQAAALTRMAQARQILMSEAAASTLPPYLRTGCQAFDQVVIKGASESTLVYRLDWHAPDEPVDATRVASQAQTRDDHLELVLTLDDRRRELTPRSPAIHIGRDVAESHLRVTTREASRNHCHVHFHRGKFVLVDHSTNGTYVQTEGAPEVYIRRESVPLTGTGCICPGRPQGAKAEMIRYSAPQDTQG